MQLDLMCVGKMKSGPDRQLLERYTDRMVKSASGVGMSWGGVREIAESRASDAKSRKADEAKALFSNIRDPKTAIIVLDETGRDLTSRQWAETIGTFRDNGRAALTVLIGGPDGHDPAIVERADKLVSLGKQTMPHQLVRIIAAEQLYRVCTILAGHPYHRQ
ncbi:MAG: 23S rRNA (pseudouridine(1915)-N(3))-methyltransferase RlmH [Pseudomonadota bacterium]